MSNDGDTTEDDEENDDLDMILNVTNKIASMASQKRHQSSMALATHITMKEKLHKSKEDRSERNQNFEMQYRHICETAALYLGAQIQEIIDGVLDDGNHMSLLKSFCAVGGRLGILLYYQDGPAPEISTGRYNPSFPRNYVMKRVYVTDGNGPTLTGRAILCYRISNVKALDNKNLSEDLFFSQFDLPSANNNSMACIYNIVGKLVHPNLSVTKEWGDLPKSALGLVTQREFIGSVNSFVEFIHRTKIDLDGVVVFTIDQELFEQYLSTPQMVKESSRNEEITDKVVSYARIWAKQIERVLTQYGQLRRENEFVGPYVENEYWRCELAKFTSIIEFSNTQECRMYVQCLTYSKEQKSKYLYKKWKKQDCDITDARNECQDNVRYLYALEKFCDPLYRCDPTQIPEYLPSLLYSIRMIFTTSRYYNNTASVTAILVKVSNQMINVCRNYVNCNMKTTVWKQPREEVLKKIEVCLDLYLKYFQCFMNTKRAMEQAGEPSFDCSEMYVFGKFETFKKRIEQIVDVLTTTIKYSILQSSTIEDIDLFANKFMDMYKKISSKKYDALNHRQDYFDIDYKEYKQKVVDTEWELEEFVGTSLEKHVNVDNVLRLIGRFEKLNLECLHLDERYLEAIEMFQDEIETLRDRYNEERQHPFLPRNIPPVSGRVMWIRQFYKRIEEPMDIFKIRYRVMRHRNSQKCIQLYNSLATVFVHYEEIYHKAWYNQMCQVRSGLCAPLLIKHPKTKKLLVNFDPYIIESIRESEYMYKLGLAVPDVGQIIVFCKEKIHHAYETVKVLVSRNEEIRGSITMMFIPLMRSQLLRLEDIFNPALSCITWTSQKIPQFCAEAMLALDDIQTFVKDVTDMKEARIDEILDSISETILVYLPPHPVKPPELVELNTAHTKKAVQEIELKSSKVEMSVMELISKFLNTVTQPDLQEDKNDWMDPEIAVKPIPSANRLNLGDDAAFKEVDRNSPIDIASLHHDCLEMFATFNMKMVDSLVKCTKNSLDTLKNRATISFESEKTITPMVTTHMELQIPIACINPQIEDIQLNFAKVLDNIINTNLYISEWAQRTAKKPGAKQQRTKFIGPAKNYYKLVSEHKEIVRVFMSLQGAMYLLKPDVHRLLTGYLSYSYLWAEDREDQVAAFCEKGPLIVEIVEKFMEFEQKGKDIKGLPEYHDVGAVRIITERFKLALFIESDAWKYILGRLLGDRYKEKLSEMVDFIKTREKILARPILNLDDCRTAMSCLQKIRENFIEMDLDLGLMEEAFSVFARFDIDVPKEDVERVDTLRFNFTNMINNSKNVQASLCEVQGPLMQELLEGVAQFAADVEKFDIDFEYNGPLVEGLQAKEASDRVILFQARFDELWRKFEMYNSGEKLFGLDLHDYPVLHKRKKEFNLLNKLYGLYIQVNKSIDGYYDILWSELVIEEIIDELTDFQNRCRKLPKAMKDWLAYLDLKQKIDDFNETCPLLEMMANKAMKDRHWRRLESVTGFKFDIESPTFTLKSVMEAPLLQYKDDVEDICIGAVKEKDIEAKLKQTIADWALIDVSFAPFKTRGELLLRGNEALEIVSLLEDSLMILNSLLSNRYNAPFKKEIQLWVWKLVTSSEVLEKWLIVQNLWVYLEAVFVGGDISKQLPAEAKRFSLIDKSWMKIMSRAHEITNVVECATGDETMTQLLPHLLEQLESCQKSLTGYLETKRLVFPRFFFISDPVLLEILGQASDPSSIQPHLPSLFDAVYWVNFDQDRPDFIIAMLSDLGELVPLEKPVHCLGGVEFWLGRLLETVLDTMKMIIAAIAQALRDPDYDFIPEFQKVCGQAGLLGVQLLWTTEAEEAIKKSRVDRWIMKATNDRFLELLNGLIDLTSKDLTKMIRTHFETMVTIHVHQRDIFDEIVKLKVKSLTDFEWQKQCRFYYTEDTDTCEVKITDVIFIYQNEYLGITERLCITPLTDRCYITLAQAIWMNMGGAPAGPAGTGKTETTKDMGRALGKFVVVFNCSDQMDFRGLGRIYKGLTQSGSWGCFDEFNRIELPVLSVAAQQIYIVLTARKERRPNFLFSDGDTVKMNIEFGIFLTMNPGYAGRQELPENLKIMFRSVAMMVPDRQIIIRVKLASCGFKQNVILSRKFFTLYALCEGQLSKQVHYDFGLRNILSVLRTLGAQKRADPSQTEDTVVMRVLRDMNLSKLVDEDEPLFLSLIEDMFPGIKLTTHTWKDLQRGITNQSSEMKLINYSTWNLKIVQLYETSLVRHGLMILGPTGAGKSSCMTCLLRCFTENGMPHKEMRMNPKAITAPQMFGRLDVATNDWTDGIFSTLWRRSLKIKKSEYVWIVLDGPVDAVWIENLNSVLDDNKTLTLANGDRIVMAANAKLVFEPDNVENASPATVSRMGMVFLSASVLPWNIIIEGWLLNRSAQEGSCFRTLYGKIFSELLLFVKSRCKPKMALLECMYARQSYDILEGLIDSNDEEEPVEKRTYTDKHLERLFIFAIMWSLGAVLELDDKVKLEEFATKFPAKLDWPKCKEDETIFEYVVNESSGKWQHWSERVEEFYYPADEVLDYINILVPNVDNVRTAFLIDIIAAQDKPVLLIGEQGTAKTVMIKGYTSTFDKEFKLTKSFNFSSATTPNMFQRIIESYIDKRVGTTYGPPTGKKMIIFIDDINMPEVNTWGDQITNEIVRQTMAQGGFYSLDKPGEFSTIVDILMLAAMIHPGGGRNDIPPRLKRRFCIFNCTLPSNNSMDMIFGSIAKGYFCDSRFQHVVVEFMPLLVKLTRILWQKTKNKMLPTPAKFHYVFNLRDLSRIWQGILTVQDLECQTVTSALKLWRHECTRVISDRFTTQEDRDWFLEMLKELAKQQLSEIYDEHFEEQESFFVDFLREPPEPTGDEPDDFSFDAPKVYEELPSWEFLKEKLFSFMEQYNTEIRGGGMDLVFFHDCMVHLFIISRIIRTSRGHAMLVGVGGSGKQSLTRLSSFIAGYQFYQIALTRSYNVGNLMDDMKHLYRVAGFIGQGITFIFTDNDIKEETFLESLNNVLSSGEIANLFAKDELDEMQSELIPVMKKVAPKNIPTNDVLYDFFLSRAKNNLHITLCFSPVGEKFRSRALMFPGLISGCTIDWFFRWPKDALTAVSSHFLGEYSIVCTPEVKVELIEMMGDVQDYVAETCITYFERFRRQTHVTPKSYLAFLNSYKVVYKEKQEGIDVLAMRMKTGLTKLVEAQASVDGLKQELAVKEAEIAVATEAAEKVLVVVLEASEQANKIKEEATIVKEKAEVLVAAISVDQEEAQKKLRAAQPALDAAEAALQTIKAADIATVRKLGKPPYLILLIMDAVLIYFKKKLEPTKVDSERLDKQFLLPSWNESLKVMADSRFMANLQQYPKDSINAEMIDLLVPYLTYPSYTFESAKTACGNVAGLISWTVAMASFYDVNREVLPLKANLAIQQNKLEKAQTELRAAMELLEAKEAEVRQCQAQYEEAMTLKQAVLDDAEKCQNKMDAATALIDGLSGERIRWTEQSAQFKSETERLIGDVLLLVGFLGYAGPFNQEFRGNMQKFWVSELIRRKIPVTLQLNVVNSLTDTATIGEWNLQGLPSDDLSIENGIIVTKASRYPLLIDPQGQGKNWVTNMEKANDLIICGLNHKYFRNYLEDCVSIGKPILIEDVGEELDPVLDNVLEKNYIKMGTTFKVKVGDKEVDVCTDFRIYITTKLANPAYTPEISARTSIIDFTVTMKGLEDQLLGRVILTEKKELETERTSLMQDVLANKRKMLELEQNLLYKLTTTQGSLVDDDTVIGTLNVTRSTAAEVKEKLEIAHDTEIKINAAREEFRPVATRGSVLYFMVTSMAMVNCMYQTSLGQFLERFDYSLIKSEKSPVTQKRIVFIIDFMTYEIFKYQCRGMYEEHKYMFVLMMVLKIDLQLEHITHDEFQNFIKGGAALDLNACPPKPAKWITDTSWLNLVELSKLRHFQYIVEQVTDNERQWKAWYDKEAPEEATLPDGYHTLDTFRKLLMIRAWCPDRTITQSRKYVASSMGERFAKPVILDMQGMLNESRPLTPVTCFLSTGSDPTPYIEQLAKRVENIVKSISMGQGQEIHARKLLTRANEEGFWALLQNCHLSLQYMNEIMSDFFEMEKNHVEINPEFRLWITTEVNEKYPIGLLQISLKFTNEPPSGVRAGLLRTYSSMNQDMLDYTDVYEYIPLVYAISFLHTVVQERRKFGPLGWNIPYEFNSADWLASCMFVQNHLEDLDPKKGISWNTLRYMLGEVQYGGRVTDDFDKRLLNTFSKVWFSETMFSPEFEFYTGYKIVRLKQVSDYLINIDKMNAVDPPQAYGLHPNADITYQTNTITEMLDTMLSIQPKESSGGGTETRESVVTRLTLDMLGKVPQDYDPFDVLARLRVMGILNPLNIFLRQEIDRMQKVISLVRITLKDLLLAIEGTIIMNEALRDSLDSIYDARIPEIWLRGSWLSSSLGFWFTELLERNTQFSTWCYQGRPLCFWMTGFFNPQGFLTAMKQEVARAHKGWALDQVSFFNDVTKNNNEDISIPPTEGVYVYGLFLDGAGWDRKNFSITESPRKVLYTLIPVVHIYAIFSTDPKNSTLYTCPVYKKKKRTDLNYITDLWLQSPKPPDHWILRGVALLCDTK